MRIAGRGAVQGEAAAPSFSVAELTAKIGPQYLLNLLRMYRAARPSRIFVNNLALISNLARDIRIRYAALLLLDKILQDRPELREAVTIQPVKAELAALSAYRVGRQKWYLRAMAPKTDLHVHIDGSTRVETVCAEAVGQEIDLADVLERSKANPGKAFALKDVPALSPYPGTEQIRALSQIRTVQPDFLKMLFLGFDFAIAVMQTHDALARTAYELMEDSWREGVMHLTAIFAPCLHGDQWLSYDARALAVIEGLKRGEREFGVTWELALAIYRGVYTDKFPRHPADTAASACRLAGHFPGQIALDVVGAEFQMPLSRFAAEYKSARKAGVILRAHAAEGLGMAENLITAHDLGVRRIGHGIQLFDLPPVMVRQLIDAGTIFEVALISNLKCQCIGEGSANVLANHSWPRMLKAGARTSLVTDDRTVMDTDNIKQMLEIEQVLGIDFLRGGKVSPLAKQLAENGFAGIAAPSVRRSHEHNLQPYIDGIEELIRLIRP